MNINVADYIADLIGGTQVGDTPEYQADCPGCGKQGHFSFNVDRFVGHCWVCNYSVSLPKLIADLEGIPFPLAVKKAEALKGTEGIQAHPSFDSALGALNGVASEPKKVPRIALPPSAIPIQDQGASPGREYLHSRGFRSSLYRKYNLMYVAGRDAEAPHLFNHIIFPEYDIAGTLIYWCSRFCGTPPRNFSKAYNCTRGKGDLLYGYNVWAAAPRSALVLVEGPLDAIALGGYGVAALGKHLSSKQVARIARIDASIYVCFDGEATQDCRLFSGVIYSAGAKKVFISLLGGSLDPADMLKQGASWASIITSIVSHASPYTGKLTLKL